jgi:hypothetical protein
VEDLPGIPFKKPCAYGASQLNAILQNKEQIKIRIIDDNTPNRNNLEPSASADSNSTDGTSTDVTSADVTQC